MPASPTTQSTTVPPRVIQSGSDSSAEQFKCFTMRPEQCWQAHRPLYPYVCSLLEMTYKPVIRKIGGRPFYFWNRMLFPPPTAFYSSKLYRALKVSLHLSQQTRHCVQNILLLYLHPRCAVMFWTTERHGIAHRTTENGHVLGMVSLKSSEVSKSLSGREVSILFSFFRYFWNSSMLQGIGAPEADCLGSAVSYFGYIYLLN